MMSGRSQDECRDKREQTPKRTAKEEEFNALGANDGQHYPCRHAAPYGGQNKGAHTDGEITWIVQADMMVTEHRQKGTECQRLTYAEPGGGARDAVRLSERVA